LRGIAARVVDNIFSAVLYDASPLARTHGESHLNKDWGGLAVDAAGSPHDYRNTPTAALIGNFKPPYRFAITQQSDISERSRWMKPLGTRLSASTAV